MSFPTLQVRPNEKNPKVLRAHEFLRQSNQLMERNLLNPDGRKLLAKSLTKMVSEVKAIYALDEKRLESEKCAKLLEKLKAMQESSTSVQEVRFNIAELQRKVLEKKIENQKLASEIESCRNFVHTTKLEAQREKEKLEERRKAAMDATETMKARSLSILKHLEDSVEGEKLRKTEEEVRVLEEEVDAMRMEDERLKEQIRANRATLKAESKKSFRNTVIECAKHYKLFHTLTPKLQRSQRNVETLREEEERRRASGSLDDTVLFDRSFVLASLEKEKEKHRQKEPSVVLPVEPPKITHIPIPTRTPQPEPVEPMEPIIQAPPVEPMLAEEPVLSSELDQVTIESEKSEESKEEEEPMEVESNEEHESHENSTINISDLSGNASIQEHEEAPEAEKSIEKNVSMETQRVVAQPEEPEPVEQEQVDKNQSIDVMEQDEPEPIEVDAPKGTEKSGKPAENFSFNFFRNSPNGESENSGSKSNDFDFGNMFGETGGGDDGSNNGSAFDFLAGGAGNEQDASNADPFGFGTSSGADGGGDTTFNFNFDGTGEDSSGNNNGGNFFNF